MPARALVTKKAQPSTWDFQMLDQERKRLEEIIVQLRLDIGRSKDDSSNKDAEILSLQSQLSDALVDLKSEKQLRTTAEQIAISPRRKRLADDREAYTRLFRIPHEKFAIKMYVTVGLYSDGSLGEVFFRADKIGSFASGLLDAAAISMSLGLQYGVPLETLIGKLRGMRFEPQGITGDKAYPMVSSIFDYVARYLEDKFLKKVRP